MMRSLYLFVISLVACYAALAWLQEDYPFNSRVVWDYALLWLWQLVLCIACLSFGRFLLIQLFKIEVPWLESWLFSMTVGLISFVLFMYMAGAIGIYGPVFAVSLPILMSTAGARLCYEDIRKWRSQAKERAHTLSLTQKVAIGLDLRVVWLCTRKVRLQTRYFMMRAGPT